MSAPDHRLVTGTLCYTKSKASYVSKISSAKHIITDLGKSVRVFLHPYVPGAFSYGARGCPESLLLGA